MKPLLILSLLSLAPVAMAAPARKRVVWEYATLNLYASRLINQNKYAKGAELFLPGGKVVFLEAQNHATPAFRTYLLNRLGSQGWELVAVTGYRDSEYKYIFKR